MSRFAKLSLSIIGCCALQTPASAETISRGSAVARAQQQNPQVAAAAARVAQAKARGGQVDSARYPSVNITLGFGPSLTAKLVPGTAVQSTRNAYGDVRLKDLSVAMGGQLSVIQPLYTFGKLDALEEASSHEVKARESQADMTRADVAFAVAELYETWLFAQDATLFFKEMLHGLESTVVSTRKEVKDQRMPEHSLLRLETARAYLQLGQHRAQAGIIQARAGLAAYLGFPEGTELKPADKHLELLPVSKLSKTQLLNLALQNRPELKALKEGQAAFNKLAEAEDAGNYPDLFAAAFASGIYTPGRDLVDTRFTYDPLNHFYPAAIVGARWRFQSGMADERASEQRAKALELQHMEKWAYSGLPAEITLALENMERAKADVDSTKIAVKRAKRWAVQAAADFGFGLGDSREVADSSAAYVQLRLAYFNAKLEYNVAVASLTKATGMLTSANSQLYPTKE